MRAHFPLRPKTLAISLLIWLLAHSNSATCHGKVSLEELVAHVTAAESLYSNIGCNLHRDLRGPNNVDFKDKRYEVVESESETVLFVSQDGRFFVDRQTTTKGISGKSVASHRQVEYDGSVTRINASDTIGNIVHARQTGTSYLFAHSVVLREEGIHMPLSAFLSTVEHRGSRWVVSVEPDAEVDGLQCHVVKHESHASDGTLALWRRLWLAPARNWFPVRIDVYMPMYSERLPRATAVARDFRELEPGIWFPYSLVRTLNDENALVKGAVQVLTKTGYTFSNVTLKPDYDEDFFQQVTFAPGLRVYELENGKIVKNYRVPAPTAQGWLVWVVVAVAVGIALLALIWVARRRSSPPRLA